MIYKAPFCPCGWMLTARPMQVFQVDQTWPTEDFMWKCHNEECREKGKIILPMWKEVQVKE